jgi:dTMP kinase
MFVAGGEDVHVTAEPSTGPLETLARELTEKVTGHALACLYAADRYHHIETEIRPHIAEGKTVISDRYIPSSLVIQRFDMAVILEADPDVISERLIERGPHNRFQLSPDSSHAENYFYRQATERLIQAGFDVLRVDCNQRAPQQVAAQILDHLTIFSHPRRSEHAAHRFPTTQIRRIDRRRNLHRRAGHAQHWREWTVSLSVHATLYDQQKAAASGPEQTRRNLLDLTASL